MLHKFFGHLIGALNLEGWNSSSVRDGVRVINAQLRLVILYNQGEGAMTTESWHLNLSAHIDYSTGIALKIVLDLLILMRATGLIAIFTVHENVIMVCRRCRSLP